MKPMMTYTEYLRFGFVRTRCQQFSCPACGVILNAGWNYQPKFCAECGQRLDFSGIAFEQEETLGYEQIEEAPLYERI